MADYKRLYRGVYISESYNNEGQVSYLQFFVRSILYKLGIVKMDHPV